MKTFETWHFDVPQIPLATVWLLNDLAEYRGKQELYLKQSPQRLNKLLQHAMIESAVTSNRIEGVEIEPQRVEAVVLGKGHLHDRDEQEVRGYQQALRLIHEQHEAMEINVATILQLHSLVRPEIWDSGKFKSRDGEIIEKHPNGRITTRFSPLSAAETPEAMDQMTVYYTNTICDKKLPSLILLAACNLDFLCIHPFRDGNGRVSRLLLLLTLYRLGFMVGRYVSLERLIEQSKERYYETLQVSSHGWHEGKHNPWPYINYLLYTIKNAYKELGLRYEATTLPSGEKTEAIQAAIAGFVTPFHITEIYKQCPQVSIDLVRKVLKDMVASGEVECLGRGKHARWQLIR